MQSSHVNHYYAKDSVIGVSTTTLLNSMVWSSSSSSSPTSIWSDTQSSSVILCGGLSAIDGIVSIDGMVSVEILRSDSLILQVEEQSEIIVEIVQAEDEICNASL